MNQTDESSKDQATRFACGEMALWDVAEKAGYENLKQRIASGDTMAAQAATLCTLLLAGIGGSLAYAVKVFEPVPSLVAWGAAAFCAYLCVLAALLVHRCINTADAPMLFNEPKNVLVPGATLQLQRPAELANLQQRIDQMIARNNTRATALNGIRYAAIASPLVFTAVAVVVSYL
ncbi:MAG: hypothetical protein HEQ39_09565 [Rhizobacter sp.]